MLLHGRAGRTTTTGAFSVDQDGADAGFRRETFERDLAGAPAEPVKIRLLRGGTRTGPSAIGDSRGRRFVHRQPFSEAITTRAKHRLTLASSAAS